MKKRRIPKNVFSADPLTITGGEGELASKDHMKGGRDEPYGGESKVLRKNRENVVGEEPSGSEEGFQPKKPESESIRVHNVAELIGNG